MAEAAIPAIPDRNTFMSNVAERFRSLGRRIIQVAKKAGNWITNLTPVKWVWNTAKSAGSRFWNWVRPAAVWSKDYLLKPAAVAFGGILGLIWGSKLIALLSAAGIIALIAVTIWVVKGRRGKEKVVSLEVVPDPPQEPEKPKRKPRRKTSERISEIVSDVTDVLEQHAEDIQAEITEAEEAAATAEETKEVIEAAKDAVAEANTEAGEAAKASTGHYKVRLPEEGELDLNETLAKRFNDLDGLINAEMAKKETDPEYLCELQGRQNLIHVRAGKHSKVKKDDTVAAVHRDFRDTLKDQWKSEHPGETFDWRAAGIYRAALQAGAMAENKRFRRLQEERDRLNEQAA